MNPSTLTIVLPCAGAGSRMRSPGPKELVEVAPSVSLIDLSLSHVHAAATCPVLDLDVVVVIDAGKEAVADHVRAHLPGIPVHRVYFDHRFREWPGSIHSAAPFCRENALVLLPDSLMFLSVEDPLRDGTGRSVAEVALDALRDHSLAFGAVNCSEPSLLETLGAMKVEHAEVTVFEDKPEKGFHRFNAVWGCIAFRREVEANLFEFLNQCVFRQCPGLDGRPFHPAAAFPLSLYADLGTPEGLKRNGDSLLRFMELIPPPTGSH